MYRMTGLGFLQILGVVRLLYPSSAFMLSMTALSPGDRVVVIGCTGGIGQLTTARLADGDYKVRALSRSLPKIQEALGLRNIEYAEADTKVPDSLLTALNDAAAVIIATGTSAFPSPRWAGNNTPDAVDRQGVRNILEALISMPRKAELKKVIFLSSIGVLRSKQLPFSLLNAFGVLDAKRDAEDLLRLTAAQHGFEYLILRPGRLVGGPWTNTDLSNLLKTAEGSKRRLRVERGDMLSGDCARISVAEFAVRALREEAVMNKELCLMNEEGPANTEEDWRRLFDRLSKS